jgi:uncharacterized membrane protein YfcA
MTYSLASGVGGGGIYVPILLAVFQNPNFSSCTALSKCLVLGNSLCQVAINLQKRHPCVYRRSLIYWEMLLIFLPSQLAGTTVGGILAKILPETVIYIIALIVLWIAIGKSSIEGKHRYEKESILKQAEGRARDNIGVAANEISSRKFKCR